MKPRVLVFDWDGTLMDSEARILACLRGAANDLGAEVRSDDQLRDIVGLGLREAVLALYPDSTTDFVEGYVQAYRVHFLERDRTTMELFPGAREVLERLAASDYRLAIATGKARNGLERVLASTGLGSRFHVTRCADETHSKPHPRMLHEIMDHLAATPDQTLMVGDSRFDLEMARRAEVPALAVSYGMQPVHRLLDLGPVGYIEDIRHLPGWLERSAREAC